MDERETPSGVEYRLSRVAALDLVFNGQLLAHESSERLRSVKDHRTRPKTHWTEITLYRVTGKTKWVVETIGKTRLADERDRVEVVVCDTAAAVLDALTTKSVRAAPHLTKLALAVLATAADRDALLRPVEAERL